VQVLFDVHGNGVQLGERDCSAQRRNQKIVEEAPAPSVEPELRARMGKAALRVAGGIGYVSAGTVEMLLTDAGEFFFLEMNTRLQVEHPVTEAVTGRDLVADQLRIASGATLAELGLAEAPPIRGHAVEARLYAEDPEAGFLPASGHAWLVRWPEGVRIDTGIAEGDAITDRYDPMLAKLIAHGATRGEALERLRAALDATAILGVRTNVRFLRWLLAQPVMSEGQVRTDTVAQLDLPAPARPETAHWQAAARMLDGPSELWSDGWRLNAPPMRRLRQGDEERSVAMDLVPGDNGPAAILAGEAVHVDVDGQSLDFTLAPPPSVDDAVRHAGATGGGASVLTAPMPGRVIAVRAAQGEHVTANQPLVVLEAMKMEHAVVAPVDGSVARVSVSVGQQVQRGDLLAELTTD
jgi:acetyl/propionyl-CoA carboxylase alpha subunit